MARDSAAGAGGEGRWRRVIGIVGGLGPHAHIELERRLLAAVEDAARDQDYPSWLLSSMPATADRTAALVAGGPSPSPQIAASLRRLEGRADFAVIACITAHAFLDEVRGDVALPILDVVEVTVEAAAERCGDGARVGLLATSGTLHSGLFQRAARRHGAVELVTLLDRPGGDGLQQRLVMDPIYGVGGSGGIKAGLDTDPATGVSYRETLTRAVGELREAGAGIVILGCTELPLALGRDTAAGLPLLDPMDAAARRALAIAAGEAPLPARP